MTFPTPVRSTALAAITSVALVLFAVVFGLLIASSVRGEIPKWIEGDFPTSMATALAGLVGGVVAIELGQTPPDTGSAEDAAHGMATATELMGTSEGRKELLAYAYLFVCLLFGVAAIIAALARPDTTANAVKNLASIFLGLVIPIARRYFAYGIEPPLGFSAPVPGLFTEVPRRGEEW